MNKVRLKALLSAMAVALLIGAGILFLGRSAELPDRSSSTGPAVASLPASPDHRDPHGPQYGTTTQVQKLATAGDATAKDESVTWDATDLVLDKWALGADGVFRPREAGAVQDMDPAQREAMIDEAVMRAESERVPHSTDPHRILPDPAGPRDGESLSDYVKRVLEGILALDGKDENSRELVALQLELEAYANAHPEAVEEVISALRLTDNYRLGEVSLLLLGRMKSVRAVDYLVSIASDQELLRPQRLEQAVVHSEPNEQYPMGVTYSLPRARSLNEIAVLALFQCAGKTGPSAEITAGEGSVRASPTSINDPYIYERLLRLISDEGLPAGVRDTALGSMIYSLPDPAPNATGDVPRPMETAGLAERALQVILGIAASPSERALQSRALDVLEQSERASVGRRVVEMAMAESDSEQRARILRSAGHWAGDATVRDGLLSELKSNQSPTVRESIIGGLRGQALVRDSVLRESLYGIVESDPRWSVRSSATSKLLALQKPEILERTIRSLEKGGLESMPESYRATLEDWMSRESSRRGLPEDLRAHMARVAARLAR